MLDHYQGSYSFGGLMVKTAVLCAQSTWLGYHSEACFFRFTFAFRGFEATRGTGPESQQFKRFQLENKIATQAVKPRSTGCSSVFVLIDRGRLRFREYYSRSQ